MERPLTAKETAQELGYHVNYLYQLLNEGKVRGERVSGIWLIPHHEVERIKALQGPGGRLPKTVSSDSESERS